MKATNWFKNETSHKRTRTPKKSPGIEFQQGAKHAALQNSIQFDANRSFLKIDTATIPQSENTRNFEIDSDSSTTQKIVASSDPTILKVTSPDSPQIGNENATEQHSFISHKSTPKIDKVVNKIKATKPDSRKQDTPKVVLLDNQTSKITKNTKDYNEELNAIE